MTKIFVLVVHNIMVIHLSVVSGITSSEDLWRKAQDRESNALETSILHNTHFSFLLLIFRASCLTRKKLSWRLHPLMKADWLHLTSSSIRGRSLLGMIFEKSFVKLCTRLMGLKSPALSVSSFFWN